MDNPYESPDAAAIPNARDDEDRCPLCGMNCEDSVEPPATGVDGARLPMLAIVVVLGVVSIEGLLTMFYQTYLRWSGSELYIPMGWLQQGMLMVRVFSTGTIAYAAWSSFRVSGRFRELPIDEWTLFWKTYRFFWQATALAVLLIVGFAWFTYFYVRHMTLPPLQ